MSELPPEIATTRRLLRQVTPLQGSKRRIYKQVVAPRVRRTRFGLRTAIIGFCLAASTSAMALGYHWVTSRVAVQPKLTASAPGSRRALPVPRKTEGRAMASEGQGTGQASIAGSTAPPANSGASASRNMGAGVASAMTPRPSAPIVEKGNPIEPPSQSGAAASELSQQVRDYHEAVAPMRADPQLALSRLYAYRSKWPRSAIGEEVELRVIEALLALGRRHDAANAASRFVQRYPSSARAPEIRRLAAESTRPGVFDD
jgi:hypothetical protein